MAEYIEREMAKKEFNLYFGGVSHAVIASKLLDSIPAADVAPVVHGRWIEKPFLLGASNFCSLCDSFYGMPHGKFNYCPNCGARMDGE